MTQAQAEKLADRVAKMIRDLSPDAAYMIEERAGTSLVNLELLIFEELMKEDQA